MRRRHLAALSAAVAVVAAGTGVAVATTTRDRAEEREQAVLKDAADRLDVSPSELRDALRAAEDAQLDADVKAGRLTQEQAEAIKRHRDREGTVLGRPTPYGRPGPPGGLVLGHHGPGHAPGRVLDAAAGAIGISLDQLLEELRDGSTLAQVAKAHGKSFADVEAAVRAAVKEDLDAAVKAGRLTRAQADELLSHLTEHLDEFGRRPPPRVFPGP